LSRHVPLGAAPALLLATTVLAAGSKPGSDSPGFASAATDQGPGARARHDTSVVGSPATERVSVGAGGAEANGPSFEGGISGNGRYLIFQSLASNLVTGDTNDGVDVFVYDRRRGSTQRVSVSMSGAEARDGTFYLEPPWLSADGRVAAFGSDASALVEGDTNRARDVFVRDRRRGRTERVSVSSSGRQGNGPSWNLRISDSGRFVTFQSDASNLVRRDRNGVTDVFVHNRESGTTRRVSVSSSGAQGNGSSYDPAISGDGRFVAFTSDASNLVRRDTNRASDVFLYELRRRRTWRVSTGPSGRQANGASLQPHLSRRGGLVAFTSTASNLVRRDTNRVSDTFVRSRGAGTAERVSVSSSGAQGIGASDRAAGFAGRRFVAFSSSASNLVRGDTNGLRDVFLHDRRTGATTRLSVSSAGAEANNTSGGARLSADGRYAAFSSIASNLVAGDANAAGDIFVRGPLPVTRR
jgi:Tol biopolymer transport system component